MLTFEYSTLNPQVSVAYGSFEAMHTQCEILMAETEQPLAKGLMEQICEITKRLDAKFNRFDPQSLLSRINRSDTTTEVALDEELYGVLEMCRLFNHATNGNFDIAAGSIPYCPGEQIVLNPARHTVRRSREGVVLDLGGFAKGFALERIKQLLQKERIRRAVVNFGNSSVLALGTHPYGDGWKVGVSDPWQETLPIHTCLLHDSALSVSGQTPRHPRHIFAPATGRYAAREGLIAVQGRSPLIAEILSTALFAAEEPLWDSMMTHYADYRAVHITHHKGASTIVRPIPAQ